jgi:hypothetical protein
MGLIEDVKKLDGSDVALGVFAFSATLAPGMLIIYLFHKELFLSLSTVKLVLLSISITIPQQLMSLFIAGFWIVFLDEWKNIGKDARVLVSQKKIALDTFWISIFTLYSFLLISYFAKWTVNEFIDWLLVIEISAFLLLLVTVIILGGRNRRRETSERAENTKGSSEKA